MPDTTILTKLRATAAVTALCGAATSIRGGTLRQKDTLPGVAVRRVRVRPVNAAGGKDAAGTKFANVDVDCIAESYETAKPLADAVEAALNGYTNTGGTPSVSMVHVTDTTYNPGLAIAGQDAIYEVFTVMCLVQYS